MNTNDNAPAARAPGRGRKRGPVIVLAALAALVAIVVAATPSAGEDRHTRRETLTFHDVTTDSSFTDLNHNGAPDPGDSFLFHEQDLRHGTVVESNDSQCTVALADNYLCHVTVVVGPRGEVILDGSVHAPGGNFPTDFDIAITGGTGDFTQARGYGHAHHVTDTTSDDTLVILP